MSAFDLDRARAGDTVEYNCDYPWREVHFIGMTIQGDPMIQITQYDLPRVVDMCNLRMAPKVRTMWVQAYVPDYSNDRVACTNPKDTADLARSSVDGHKLLGEPQPITITEE